MSVSASSPAPHVSRAADPGNVFWPNIANKSPVTRHLAVHCTSWADESSKQSHCSRRAVGGVESSGAPGWKPGCKRGDGKEHDRHAGENHGVGRFHAHQHRGDHASKNKGRDCLYGEEDDAQADSLKDDQAENIASFCS